MQHIPGNNVFFAHKRCPSQCKIGLLKCSGEKRLREIIEIGRAEYQLNRGIHREFLTRLFW
ncbi:hypothetical protein FS595_04465 [Serratia rubidaea]|nr:hypothetical protein FS596_04465 [Serratia rubidaea]UJD83546.1 hypothetical protein FS595_04465 [Serratia rubidaea]